MIIFLGMVWMIRMIATSMNKGTYDGTLTIYCHEELVHTIKTLTKLTVGKKIFISILMNVLYFMSLHMEIRFRFLEILLHSLISALQKEKTVWFHIGYGKWIKGYPFLEMNLIVNLFMIL